MRLSQLAHATWSRRYRPMPLKFCGADALVRGRPPGRPSDLDENSACRARAPGAGQGPAPHYRLLECKNGQARPLAPTHGHVIRETQDAGEKISLIQGNDRHAPAPVVKADRRSPAR